MLNIVGSSPSSGSTLLADLLDSTDYSACGEENNIFSIKKFYDFKKFKNNIEQRSVSSVYLYSEGISWPVLHQYGLDKSKLKNLFESANTPYEFGCLFSRHFLNFRKKDVSGVVFEKTPNNIYCIDEFLNNFPDSFFIFVARNPLFVFDSLLRRGFSPYIAFASWYLSNAKYFKFKDHPKVLLIKYEDLVQNPFGIIKDVLNKSGIHSVTESEIKENFEGNEYRKSNSIRLPSWSVKDVGIIKNSNDKIINESIVVQFFQATKYMINTRYSQLFDLADVSFDEISQHLGYYDDLESRRRKVSDSQIMKPRSKQLRDHWRLFYRWYKAFLRGESHIKNISTYINPMV